MPGGRLLNRGDLDEAFPGNPVRIDHVSMHGAVLNSLALKKYGISASTPTPAGGVIVRKPGSQEPWGLIMETAFLPVVEQSEAITAQQELDWSRAGQMLYAQTGITTAQEGASHLPQIATIKRAADAGANLIDVVAYPFITDLDKVLALIPVSQWGRYNNRFKIGGVKITIDGSHQGRTAFFTTPYLTGGPAGEKNWRGEPTFPQDLVDKAVSKVYRLGVLLLAHTNGAAAIDMFLKAYASARKGDVSRPWNVSTIHSQFLRKDQIPSFVKYGIRPHRFRGGAARSAVHALVGGEPRFRSRWLPMRSRTSTWWRRSRRGSPSIPSQPLGSGPSPRLPPSGRPQAGSPSSVASIASTARSRWCATRWSSAT